VIGLRGRGFSTRQIADAIGIGENTVTALEVSAGRSRRASAAGEVVGRAALLPSVLLDRLGPHAARRGITVLELLRRILKAVIDGKLVDAVLDDADEVATYLEGEAA
jgi:hypothetical protein